MDKEHQKIQALLRSGLALAMVLMLLGLGLKIASGDFTLTATAMSSIFKSGLPPGDRIMGLGIIALAFTPVFRVFALLLLWIRERDWRFAAIAAVVLLLLGVAIALGGA